MKPDPQATRKARQLCRQVERSLRLLLPSCADERLQNLLVVQVEPAPHTGRLKVTVAEASSADATHHATLLQQLTLANAWLRRHVAASIHRRKAPELVFVVE